MQAARHDGSRPGAEQVGLGHCERHAIGAHGAAERPRCRPDEIDEHRQMVLQVAADWQIDHRRDVDAAQVFRRADAGKHQELGRVEGATAKNHLAHRFGAHDLAVLHVLDADRVRAPQQQARGLSAGCANRYC